MPRIALATLESNSPYSQSRPHDTPRLKKELPDDYEERTWRDKCHADDKGRLFIPPMCFKSALVEVASLLSEKIKGKGAQTWTRHFLVGVQVFDPLPLPLAKDKMGHEWVYCHANGKRGSGTRVWRCFPVIPHWMGEVKFYVVDSTITRDVFDRYLAEAGNFIGIGRWRAGQGGQYGRWTVKAVRWIEE